MGAARQRLAFIDLLRGVAVLAMVETHVTNAFLRVNLRDGGWFNSIDFVNGLVAPSFLFIAGYAFVMTACRRWDGVLGFKSPFWKQLLRILQIWIIAYWLHMPHMSLRRLLSGLRLDQPHLFWRVDVLHLIALSLLFLLLLLVVTRRKWLFGSLLVLTGTFFIFVNPALSSIDFLSVMPAPLAAYFNYRLRSLFPIFPWAAFVLAGALASLLWLRARDRNCEADFFRWSAVVGTAMVLVATLAPLNLLRVPGAGLPWKETPGGCFTRLGLVLLLLSLCRLWDKRLDGRRALVAVAGQESLPVYVMHLMIIYGMFFSGHSLNFIIGRTCSPLETAVMSALLIALMVAMAVGWNWLKREHPGAARRGLVAVTAALTLVVLLKP
jgi:uncharacterized membrane protein